MLDKIENIENKTVIVEQIGSETGSTKRLKDTLKGLGLRGIGSKSELKCSKSVYGMLVKAQHLLKISVKE